MPNLFYEKQHGRDAGKVICGVDEAGRGPLAGPVTAAAVILPATLPRAITREIRDSKKMTAQQREDLFEPLTTTCGYAIAEATVEEIAKHNILWASMLAMKRAVESLSAQVDVALIDGNRCPQLACQAVAIIEGDDKSLSIAAASIIAKVTRDRLMRRLAEEHPGYGWERNAGYGTREHLDALKRLGATCWHRDSFAPIRQLELLNG
ncbi:MAG: ribonuclease HII [Alphaproteobacteria bacterium]|nr:ribonuclease HII [Alphaproteobacteria bacterium]